MSATIASRQAKYLEAWNTHDVQGTLSFFADDARYSDFIVDKRDMDKNGIGAFLKFLWEVYPDLHFDTVALSGTEDLTVWEWTGYGTVTNVSSTDTERVVGQKRLYTGVSIAWWNKEGKITRNHDYWGYKLA